MISNGRLKIKLETQALDCARSVRHTLRQTHTCICNFLVTTFQKVKQKLLLCRHRPTQKTLHQKQLSLISAGWKHVAQV